MAAGCVKYGSKLVLFCDFIYYHLTFASSSYTYWIQLYIPLSLPIILFCYFLALTAL
jgi:hypothetical protein